ncbi:MAG: putative toxin-antitoxin system toxin component, PIN family [Chitinophagales bacterium]
MNIVLDTNVLLVSISTRSSSNWVFQQLVEGGYMLSVTTDILDEYTEIIEQQMGADFAQAVVDLLVDLPNLNQINKYYFWQLIEADPDDNKFVDYVIAANADYIVSEDRHFRILKNIEFPKVEVLTIEEFKAVLLVSE